MKTTYKVKFLDCNISFIQQTLKKAGAFSSLHHYRATIFNGLTPDQDYVRVRDEDHLVTLQIVRNGKVTANEIIRNSYEEIVPLLKTLGFIQRRSEERYQLYSILEGVSVEVESWPGIPAYVRLEAESQEALHELCKTLDLDLKLAFDGDIRDIFLHYGLDINDITDLVFPKGRNLLVQSNY